MHSQHEYLHHRQGKGDPGKPGLTAAVGKGATEKAKVQSRLNSSGYDLPNTGTSWRLSFLSCRMGIISPGILSHKMNRQSKF